MKKRLAFIEIIEGPAGCCVSISLNDKGGTRVAGPKPWGGGKVVKRFRTTVEDILSALPEPPLPQSIQEALNSGDGVYRP